MKTLAAPSRYEALIRKSRFVAHAAPVRTQADTLAFFESVADPGATHNCWAWRVDHLYRSNDDGEPGGSAGRPILAAIEGRELQGVMVVVTRWFGGIKLGAGGLVRAYGGAAAECLRTAPRQPIIDMVEARLRVGFEHAASLHALLTHYHGEKLEERFDADGSVLRIRIPCDNAQPLALALRDSTRGQSHFELVDD